MWNKPTEKQLRMLPKIGSTERIPVEKKTIYMHFFLGGNDWFIAEYDEKNRELFGYAVLNGDWEMSEWGYISLDELESINVRGMQVDRDLHWKPKKFEEILREKK